MQTNSIKDRRGQSEKVKRFKTPIITTTAATPQDSPNTTLESGASFKHWEQMNFECIDKASVSKFYF